MPAKNKDRIMWITEIDRGHGEVFSTRKKAEFFLLREDYFKIRKVKVTYL